MGHHGTPLTARKRPPTPARPAQTDPPRQAPAENHQPSCLTPHAGLLPPPADQCSGTSPSHSMPEGLRAAAGFRPRVKAWKMTAWRFSFSEKGVHPQLAGCGGAGCEIMPKRLDPAGLCQESHAVVLPQRLISATRDLANAYCLSARYVGRKSQGWEQGRCFISPTEVAAGIGTICAKDRSLRGSPIGCLFPSNTMKPHLVASPPSTHPRRRAACHIEFNVAHNRSCQRRKFTVVGRPGGNNGHRKGVQCPSSL